MTAPNPALPGISVAVCRRCSRRCFFLRPSSKTNALVGYCLGVTLRKHPGVHVSAFTFMSNHYHMVVSADDGNLGDFYRDFNGLVARAMNCALGRGENFWASGGLRRCMICDAPSLWDQLVYATTNPVKDGLVETCEQWPGLLSLPEDVGTRRFRFERPEQFFRSEGPGALPDAVEFELEVPPEFAGMDPEEFRREYRRRVDERVAEVRSERAREGRGFLTARAVMDQDPHEAAGDTFPDRDVTPRIACRDPARYKGLLMWLSEFRLAHWCAWQLWSRGHREVCFPYGTFWMRVKYGVRCRDPDGSDVRWSDESTPHVA